MVQLPVVSSKIQSHSAGGAEISAILPPEICLNSMESTRKVDK